MDTAHLRALCGWNAGVGLMKNSSGEFAAFSTAVLLAFSCAAQHGTKPADAPTSVSSPRPVLTVLDGGLAIRAEADTLEALIEKTRPDFLLPNREMLWISSDASGNPVFTLDGAYEYKPAGGKARWVLLCDFGGPGGIAADEWRGYYKFAVIALSPEVPVHDPGPGDYATVKASDPAHGTLYEIGWEAGPSGSGLYIMERNLYLLRDAAGKWAFVGEGPVTGSSRGAYWGRESQVAFTGLADAPVTIRFTTSETKAETISSDELSVDPTLRARRDLVTYEDCVLDGPLPAKLRREDYGCYMLAGKDDSLETLAECLAAWPWPGTLGSPAQLKAKWVSRLAHLNPALPNRVLPEGTRVRLPRHWWLTFSPHDPD